MSNFKLVQIDWIDASTIKGWSTLDEVIHHNVQPAIVHQVGYLIGSDNKCTSIAPAWSEETCDSEEQFLNVQRIPKAFIKKIVDL